MGHIGWETHGEPGSQVYLLPLASLSTTKLQRPKKVDFELINYLRKRHYTLGFYYEPGLSTKETGTLGHSLPAEPFAHSATSLLDLTLDDKSLLASFTSKTRYNIGLALRQKKLSIVSVPLSLMSEQYRDDFLSLRKVWSKTKHIYGYELKFVLGILESFRGYGTLHIAYKNKTPVATLLVLYHERVATYWAAFCTPSGYSHFGPTLLTWVSLLAAKEAGCDIYDFGGVYDPRYPRLYKKWQGFTKFKSGFNPTYIEYPKTRLQIFW